LTHILSHFVDIVRLLDMISLLRVIKLSDSVTFFSIA